MKNKLLTPLNIWGVIALVAVGIIFYWFGVRPSAIIKECHRKGETTRYASTLDEAVLNSVSGREITPEHWDTTSNNSFDSCIHEKGLK